MKKLIYSLIIITFLILSTSNTVMAIKDVIEEANVKTEEKLNEQVEQNSEETQQEEANSNVEEQEDTENLNKQEKVKENKIDENEQIETTNIDLEKESINKETTRIEEEIDLLQSIEPQQITNGVYTIKPKINEEKALDINYSSLDNNANLEIYTYKNSGNNQKFKITDIGNGYYQIQALCSAKMITVQDESIQRGTNVVQYEEKDNDAQKWIIKQSEHEGYYYIISKINNLYLTAHEDSGNVNVDSINVDNTDLQLFKFITTTDNDIKGTKTVDDKMCAIKNYVNNNMLIDITATSLSEGVAAELYIHNDRNNQKFTLTYLGDGYYKIEAIHSKLALTVTRALTTEGTSVEQRKYCGADSQKWVIQDAGDGYYYIISKCNGLALDARNKEVKSGVALVTNEFTKSNSQKFRFDNTNYYQYMRNDTFTIKSAIDTSMVIDVTGRSTESGTNIEIWYNKYMGHQMFTFIYLGNGEYRIQAKHSGKYLTLEHGGTQDNINVIQKDYEETNLQKWEVVKAMGYYYITSKANNLYLSIETKGELQGANISVCSWLPYNNNYKKFFIEKEEYKGIDVSKFQGDIDWSQVGNAGIDFAIMRIGYRGYRTGKIVADEKFVQNVRGAQNNGINAGAYFVTQARNYYEGEEEAYWVIDYLRQNGISVTYPIVIDVEWAGGAQGNNGLGDNISVYDRTQAILGFCRVIQNAGYIPMIYANKTWLTSYIDMNYLFQYDVWLAHYVNGAPTNKSDYTGTYVMWQYTSSGYVSGINGNVDMNIGYKKYN